MNRCPITYEPCGSKMYSDKGLRILSRNITNLKPFPYSAEEQVSEAVARASKMSIQGVQPKLSARLSIKEETFTIVDKRGTFILKPQNLIYKELPQNEDLTMRLAGITGLEVPLHGMIYSKDRSLTYFIKRFDRTPQGKKFAMEDFAQLAGMGRENKYRYSMEKVIDIIDKYCTFPSIERIKFFRLVLFNFLTGNEDAHLKNFSLISKNNKIILTPCYDLLNSTISANTSEEIALPLKGKKKNITRKDLIDYYGRSRLNLNERIIAGVLSEFAGIISKWGELIEISFLSDEMKAAYKNLIGLRAKELDIS